MQHATGDGAAMRRGHDIRLSYKADGHKEQGLRHGIPRRRRKGQDSQQKWLRGQPAAGERPNHTHTHINKHKHTRAGGEKY